MVMNNVISDYLLDNRRYLRITKAGLIAFIFGTTLALLVTPDYSFSRQWFSELGTGESGYIFNISIIFAALLISFFYPITFYLLLKRGYSPFKSFIGMALGIISFISLLLIGLYNMNSGIVHWYAATLFVLISSVNQFLLTSAFMWYHDSRHDAGPKMEKSLSLLVIGITISFIIVFLVQFTPILFLLQKITIYAIILITYYQLIRIYFSDCLFES